MFPLLGASSSVACPIGRLAITFGDQLKRSKNRVHRNRRVSNGCGRDHTNLHTHTLSLTFPFSRSHLTPSCSLSSCSADGFSVHSVGLFSHHLVGSLFLSHLTGELSFAHPKRSFHRTRVCVCVCVCMCVIFWVRENATPHRRPVKTANSAKCASMSPVSNRCIASPKFGGNLKL